MGKQMYLCPNCKGQKQTVTPPLSDPLYKPDGLPTPVPGGTQRHTFPCPTCDAKGYILVEGE